MTHHPTSLHFHPTSISRVHATPLLDSSCYLTPNTYSLLCRFPPYSSLNQCKNQYPVLRQTACLSQSMTVVWPLLKRLPTLTDTHIETMVTDTTGTSVILPSSKVTFSCRCNPVKC
jgi:hypothetical protein